MESVASKPEMVAAGIRRWMNVRGLRQQQLASIAGFTQAYISKILSSKVRNLPSRTLAKLAGALEITVDELRQGPQEEDKKPVGSSIEAIGEHVSSLESEIRTYQEQATALHADLPVSGFVTQLKVAIDIEEIFISGRALLDLRGVNEGRFSDSADAEKCLMDSQDHLEISLSAVFGQCSQRRKRGIVILGDPGAGKTTYIKRLLLACVRRGSKSLGLPADMVPVFLSLRNLQNLNCGLEDFIQQQLTLPHLDTRPGFAGRLLKRGRLLLLFDGLDEVADQVRRQQVSAWIGQALKVHMSCRFAVTCRYAGYSPEISLNQHFLEVHIRPLTRDQAETFIGRWYGIVESGLARNPAGGERIARERSEALIARLREPGCRAQRVSDLMLNPLMLTNLCLVHRHRGTLPKHRARLYRECIDVLLENWCAAKGHQGMDAAQARRVLQPAALWMHRVTGRLRTTADELIPVIEPFLEHTQFTGMSAKAFLEAIRDQTGILTSWGRDRYGFMHLGFQEYLAACEIRRQTLEDPAVLGDLAVRFGDTWWQEVILLLLALEDASLFKSFMTEVMNRVDVDRFPDLMDMCLEDAAEISIVPFLEILRAKPGKKPEFWQRQLAALRVLNRLDSEASRSLHARLANHPNSEIRAAVVSVKDGAAVRIITETLTGYELIHIPGGTFMMGSTESEEGHCDDEGPAHAVQVPSFYLGRYPVTHAQYAEFLRACPEVKEPKYWRYPGPDQALQPVVGVSWEEGRQYARWAGLRLPTEAEWEYACRAGTSTRYSAGDTEGDLARTGWYGANSNGKPHPVGSREPNPFGLYDMHGNVLEWIEDDWHSTYGGAPTDGSPWIDAPQRAEGRVLRGGCWLNVAPGCRSAIRYNYDSDARDQFFGFRLAKS